MKEQIREILEVVYRNGVIDGKQNTSSGTIVVNEALTLLQEQKQEIIEGERDRVINYISDEEGWEETREYYLEKLKQEKQ